MGGGEAGRVQRERGKANGLRLSRTKGLSHLKTIAKPAAGPLTPAALHLPLLQRHAVSNLNASSYFARVPSMISAGMRGPGAVLFQSSVSR